MAWEFRSFWHLFLILLPDSIVKSKASQYSFLYNFQDSVPPTEAFLYGCINWSLAQAQQQSSLGLSVCYFSARWQEQREGWFSVQCTKAACGRVWWGSVEKKPHSDPRTELSEWQKVLTWWCICQFCWL